MAKLVKLSNNLVVDIEDIAAAYHDGITLRIRFKCNLQVPYEVTDNSRINYNAICKAIEDKNDN